MRLGFIVEGTNDERIVKAVKPGCEVVTTRGTRFNNAIKQRIEEMQSKVDKVYILTDPDNAGDLMAVKLKEFYGFERVSLDPDKCKKYIGRGKWKTGVEHADLNYLRDVLDRLFNL